MIYDFMTFAEKLNKLIDSTGTNQSKLSRKTGIAQSAISDMTKGKRRAYMDQAFEIARALGVSLDYLADDAQDEPLAVAMTERERMVWEVIKTVGADEAWRILVGSLAQVSTARVIEPVVVRSRDQAGRSRQKGTG